MKEISCFFVWSDFAPKVDADAQAPTILKIAINMLHSFSHLQGIHPAVQELYNECRRGKQVYQPSISQLENTLNLIIQQLPSAYTIVLDAMDECKVEEKAYVSKWVEKISGTMPIAITSRDFSKHPGSSTILRTIGLHSMECGVKEDISIFLEEQIQMHFEGDLKDQILDALKAKAQGQ